MLFIAFAAIILALPSVHEGRGPISIASCTVTAHGDSLDISMHLRQSPPQAIRNLKVEVLLFDDAMRYYDDEGHAFANIAAGTSNVLWTRRLLALGAMRARAARCRVASVRIYGQPTWIHASEFHATEFDNT